ncbi:ABC transporter permease [Sutcliffiella deserti]|uniref:ABC transporter permease n=1 Tax=Sutcliffiella deserti TaxID=2875501 RepID=UPI001CC18363|nr:ABC transporter permease [Sutcliffiella deserti]
MFEKQFYSHVEKSTKVFLSISIIIILLFSGISFTFVIPGLKGFDLFFTFITLLMYFMAANIFVGLFKDSVGLVFVICLCLSSLGMGWRLWLEWGEFSLIEHANLIVYVGYPIVKALMITGLYRIIRSVYEKNSTFVSS